MLTLREAIMMRRVVVLLTSFLIPCMYAQSGSGSQDRTGSIRVRVTPGDARTCNIRATVSLVSTSGAHIAEDLANSDCEVYFVNVAPGSYRVTVSGAGIENADSGRFDLDSHRRQDLDINITYTREAEHGRIGPAGSLVAAVDLNIPESAKKEFDKANQFVAKGNWQKAIERLNKAIAIYPEYAEAYNNLGVGYGRLGDRTRNLEALQKAVSLNDHFAPAYLNLARMAIADRDLVQAEAMLDKAVPSSPRIPRCWFCWPIPNCSITITTRPWPTAAKLIPVHKDHTLWLITLRRACSSMKTVPRMQWLNCKPSSRKKRPGRERTWRARK